MSVASKENGKDRRALVLDGSKEGRTGSLITRGAVMDELTSRGLSPKCLVLRDMNISPCLGCFGCWVRTPGECVLKDDHAVLIKELVCSDLLVIITPITFGGHSSEVKKALDRSIAIFLPFLRMNGGEVHHPMRYRERYDLLAIGTMPRDDARKERTFRELVDRNAINLRSARHKTCVLLEDMGEGEMRKAVTEAISEVGA